jgi:hypothetical protein
MSPGFELFLAWAIAGDLRSLLSKFPQGRNMTGTLVYANARAI